ncbi:MAG: class I SAM-dependent methyltransferase [Xanthobacter sp.]
MIPFSPKAAADYDVRIPRLVPGYDLVQDLAASLLGAELGPQARIFVAGCGTGFEIAHLARTHAGWLFTGLDPSAAMLDKARERLDKLDMTARAIWVEAALGEVAAPSGDHLPHAGAHDAALAFLVDHFVPDDGSRLRFLEALAQSVQPGAPVLLFHQDASGFEPAYVQWLRAQGHDGTSAQAVLTRIRKLWFPLPPERLATLLQEAGLKEEGTFFRSLSYRGLIARRL